MVPCYARQAAIRSSTVVGYVILIYMHNRLQLQIVVLEISSLATKAFEDDWTVRIGTVFSSILVS